MDGGAFTDGIGRKTFFLKVTKRCTDGTTTLTKTVPCGGSTTHTCLVEVLVEFYDSTDEIGTDEALLADNQKSRGGDGDSTGPVGSTSDGSVGRSNRPQAPSKTERRLQDSSDTVGDAPDGSIPRKLLEKAYGRAMQ
eukprot:jgi/Undpi1/4353/HiC_scaffold_17.g07719.m1